MWLTDLVTILSRWTLGSRRPRQTNRTLDTVTTSWTLRPFLTLEEQQHLLKLYFENIKTRGEGQRRGRKKKLYVRNKKHLQVLPSLQQDLGDPEGQVYRTGQLDQLDQQDLSHQESPV